MLTYGWCKIQILPKLTDVEHKLWMFMIFVHYIHWFHFFVPQPLALHKFTSFKVYVSEWCCHLRRIAWNCCQSLGFLERLSRFFSRTKPWDSSHHWITIIFGLEYAWFTVFPSFVFFSNRRYDLVFFSSFEVSKEVKRGGVFGKASMHFRWLMQFCLVLAPMIRLAEG